MNAQKIRRSLFFGENAVAGQRSSELTSQGSRRALHVDRTESSIGQRSGELITESLETPETEDNSRRNGDALDNRRDLNFSSTKSSMEVETKTPSNQEDQHTGGYATKNRRRLRGMKERNEKGRGCNIVKALTQRLFIDVNEKLQPIGKSARSLSSHIGCLVRDPRRLPPDCTDWRRIEKQKLEDVWKEVKRSYFFPEGREPRDWGMMKMNACWRGYKSDLKVACFDGKTLDDAMMAKPKQIPDETWSNMVNFWSSDLGQARINRAIENRANSKMCHYAETKSFACLRAEKRDAETGEEPDELDMWLETHKPKKGSKLDDASTLAKDTIDKELAAIAEGTHDNNARSNIFKKVIGENTNGYAKTFGLGVKVPRSLTKRCALEEERAKRIRSEEQVQNLQEQVQSHSVHIGRLTNLLKKVIQHQGLDFEDDDDDEVQDDQVLNGTNHEEDEQFDEELEDLI